MRSAPSYAQPVPMGDLSEMTPIETHLQTWGAADPEAPGVDTKAPGAPPPAAATELEPAAAPAPPPGVCWRVCWGAPLKDHYFLVGMLLSLLLAALKPAPGAKGGILHPEVTSSWVAVWIIFVISGWSLKTKELVNAVKYCRLNTAVQAFNLGVIPFGVYGLAELLRSTTSIDDSLLKGRVTLGVTGPLTPLKGGPPCARAPNSTTNPRVALSSTCGYPA